MIKNFLIIFFIIILFYYIKNKKRLNNKIKNIADWYMPNERFPVIIDSNENIVRGMILYSATDDDPAVFTKYRIVAHSNIYYESGIFEFDPFIKGYIYYLSDLNRLKNENVIKIMNGTSKKFLAEFYSDENLKEQVRINDKT